MSANESDDLQTPAEETADTPPVAWMVIQKRKSEYADKEGQHYEYPLGIPNSRNIEAGHLLILIRTKDEQDADGGRIFGIGRVREIFQREELDDRKRPLFRAVYDHYLPLEPTLSFDAMGGDPRNNTTNAITKLSPKTAEEILEKAGGQDPESWPAVVAEPERKYEDLSPEEIREEIQTAITKDLLGPAEGPDEEYVGPRPSVRYLVGKLAPRRSDDHRSREEESASEAQGLGGDAKSSEDGSDDSQPPATENLTPSSMGITFAIADEVSEFEVTARWGRYERVTPEDPDDEIDEDGFDPHGANEADGQTRTPSTRAWRRHEHRESVTVSLDDTTSDEVLTPDDDTPDVKLYVKVRASQGAQRVISLFLVNEQEEPDLLKDQAWLFQSEISVRDKDGKPIFRRRRPADDSLDPEQKMLEMLYRDHVEFAVGHGVSVDWEEDPEDSQRAVSVRSRFLPEYEVPATDATSPDDHAELAGIELGMRELAELPEAELFEKLAILPDAYEQWIQGQTRRVANAEVAGYEDVANENLKKCQTTCDRIREGIDAIRSDEKALKAFRFANLAMALQRTRGIYSRLRRRGSDVTFDQIDDDPNNRRWRPFQLGFLLLSLPSLVDPLHKERTGTTDENLADLIWFPTGGGKTEAYLGLTAFTLAIRRLQGEVGGLDGSAGVTVLMRYTLRLLTIQQFQRATTLMCALEYLRRKDAKQGEECWGGEPFRIGLWVGAKVTPNNTDDSARAVREHRSPSNYGGADGDPMQLKSCPWCGHELNPKNPSHVDVDQGRRRTLLYCGDRHCQFSKRLSVGEGLPVVVVDEEIYRLVPGLVIATVDKFAQLPWQGEMSALFGRVSGRCERHGYLTPAREELQPEKGGCRGVHPRKGPLPAVQRQETPLLRPPDLIIQDELHLISGPLGTMVGQFETALDHLSSWELDGKTVRPKLVASTATVRRAKNQVNDLFCRRVQIFPPPGLEVGNDFFSIRRPVDSESPDRKPGRRYLGICSPGSSRIRVLIQAYVTALTAGKAMFDRVGAKADPWMTVVGYFNSIRELGGMVRHLEDDVQTQCYRVERAYPRPGLAQRTRIRHEELTSRLQSTRIPEILDHLEVPYREQTVRGETTALDAVLATNMISVGVDVERLGLMIVNGQPKTTSEYIQSSSRVGRNEKGPGLVLTLLNWARPRDLSHYESFRHYHATFYSQVEALSVTPFAPRAIDRGLTGVITGLLRQSESRFNPNQGAKEVTAVDLPELLEVRSALISRAHEITQDVEVKQQLEAEIDHRFELWKKEALMPGRDFGYRKKRGAPLVAWLRSPAEGAWTQQSAPLSLREVEQNVQLIYEDPASDEGPDWQVPPSDATQSSDSGDES